MGFFVAARAFAELSFEAAALFFGIVEFAKSVAYLQAADKNFETLYPIGIFSGSRLFFESGEMARGKS